MFRWFAVLLLLLPDVVVCQLENMGFGSGRRSRDKEPLAVKEDMECIKCDVCQMVASEIFDAVEKKRLEAPSEMVRPRPGAAKVQRSTFSEAEVNAIVVDACHRRKEVGEWLWHFDLVASDEAARNPWRGLTKKEKATGKKYLLVDRRARGGDAQVRKWDRESATVKRSCDLLFDDDVADLEDFIVPLWRGTLESPKDASRLLCETLSGRCGKNKMRKPIADNGREDFPFIGEATSIVETERMMQNMEEQGMPMVMQSRDDMMQELLEGLMNEGMTEDEAKDFIEETQKSAAEAKKPPPPGNDELDVSDAEL